MKIIENLEKLCEIVEEQIGKAVKELESDPGKLPMQDAEYLDKLTHTMKSIKGVMAMEGAGSSERRGRNRMGRYVSREGASYDEDDSSEWYPRYAYEGGGSRRGSYEGGSLLGSYEGRSMHGDREKLERLMEETDDPSVKRALREAMRNI